MKIKLITKQLEGLAWDPTVTYNYFRALIITDEGEELNPKTIWSKSENEAVAETMAWYAQRLRESAELVRDYQGYPCPTEGRANRRNYTGYYTLRDDEQWVEVVESVHDRPVAPMGKGR